ncbi:unnamed protein product [Cladocopium goreaui]|uniref:Uncharacterized protein n=1 Tax=Cladocopium goreaui TaxID=2562237 RepID=A0A9P1BH26_9DINO|nr:unnamed protein product [Cladocopium goreaui]
MSTGGLGYVCAAPSDAQGDQLPQLDVELRDEVPPVPEVQQVLERPPRLAELREVGAGVEKGVSWCDVRDESSDDQMNEHLRSPDDFRAGKGRNATSEASTSETGKPIGIGLVEALGMTANGEVPQVSAQPAMASGTAPSAQSFCKMVVLPVVAIPILRKWWIYAPGEFIKQKEGRIRNKPSLDSSITPWIGGKEIQPMFRVLVEEIPAAMLRCAECVKAKGLCIKNQKQVVPKYEIHYVDKEVVKHEIKYIEKLVEVPHVIYEERIIEVPQVERRELIRHVPVSRVQVVDKKVPRHMLQVTEKTVEVPTVITEEVPQETLEVVVVETITEVPKIQMLPVPVEVPKVVNLQIQERLEEVHTTLIEERVVEVTTREATYTFDSRAQKVM